MYPSQLHLIPTPLAPGAAGKLTAPQVTEIVKDLRIFYVENLKTARRFIAGLGLTPIIDQSEFYILDKKTSENQIMEFFEQSSGAAVGIMSEAGMPGVADPGAVAVRMAHEFSIPVNVLPGPVSMMLALAGSGFSGQSFTFHGYLPISRSECTAELKKIERLALSGATQIFMETPFRNAAMLKLITDTLQPNARLCVAASLTGADAKIKTMTVANWKKKLDFLGKEPAVFLVGQ